VKRGVGVPQRMNQFARTETKNSNNTNSRLKKEVSPSKPRIKKNRGALGKLTSVELEYRNDQGEEVRKNLGCGCYWEKIILRVDVKKMLWENEREKSSQKPTMVRGRKKLSATFLEGGRTFKKETGRLLINREGW